MAKKKAVLEKELLEVLKSNHRSLLLENRELKDKLEAHERSHTRLYCDVLDILMGKPGWDKIGDDKNPPIEYAKKMRARMEAYVPEPWMKDVMLDKKPKR